MNLTLQELFDRFGPTAALIVTLVLLVLLLPSNVHGSGTRGTLTQSASEPSSLAQAAQAAATSQAGAGANQSTGSSGGQVVAHPGLIASGSNDLVGNGALRGCRSDGRMSGISVYMPPCVPLFTGSNGGATARGVSPTSITVVRYIAQANAAEAAALTAAGVQASAAQTTSNYQVLFRYFNMHYETYKRQVKLVDYHASGASTDDSAARADAIDIAQRIKAFAVFPSGGAGDPAAFDQELAAEGVICVFCGLSPPDSFYTGSKGYLFGGYPPNEFYYRNMAEYICKRLAGRPARWAGDAITQRQKRNFGLIWVENAPLAGGPPEPARKTAVDMYRGLLAKCGVTLTDASYSYDLSSEPNQATTIVAKMKQAGVNNLAFVGDAISPTFFTKEATREAYFPEWFVTGNLATDSVILGRAYDQTQWAHAFGIGFLFVFPQDITTSAPYREYKHMNSSSDPGTPGTGIDNNAQQPEAIFTGIQMAGPDLTAKTFAQGLYNFPASGGDFGNWRVQYTPQNPTAVKDFKEIYWDASARGPDEDGTQGVGEIRSLNSGKRYSLGQWPTGEPNMFNAAGTVIYKDDPSPSHEQNHHKHPTNKGCRSCAPYNESPIS